MTDSETTLPVAVEQHADSAWTARRILAAIWSGLRKLLKAFAYFLLIVFVLGFLGVAYLQILFYLLFGWVIFLSDVVPKLEVNVRLWMEGLVCAAVLCVGAHHFCRWLYASMFPEVGRTWRPAWTACGLFLVMLLFVAGIGSIGLIHQVGWLLGDEEPMIEHGFPTRAKVSEGVSISSPARTAIGVACSEGTLADATNETLGLAAPGSYVGDYVRSVTAEGLNEDAAKITIVYDRIRSHVKPGDTLVYIASCGPAGTQWRVEGTVPSRYWPKT